MSLFEPTYLNDPRYQVDPKPEAPVVLMRLHDELAGTHDVEFDDDLTELFISGGRLSVTEARYDRVNIRVWPMSGSTPLVISEELEVETALEFLGNLK